MKLLFCILFTLLVSITFAQPVVNRSASVVTVKDARPMAGLNLFVPIYRDTVEANLPQNIGIDTAGAIIFTRDYQMFWGRKYSPKRWEAIGSGGGGSLNNLGVGYRFGVQGTSNIRTFFAGYGGLLDSTSHANALTLTVDSTKFYLYSNPLHFITDTSLVASVLYPLYPYTSTILAIDTGGGRPANKTYVTTRSLVDSLLSFGSSPTLQQVFNREVGGSVLTKNDTIQMNTRNLRFLGTTNSLIFISTDATFSIGPSQPISASTTASNTYGGAFTGTDNAGGVASYNSTPSAADIVPGMLIARSGTGAGVDGIGVSISFALRRSNSTLNTAGQIVVKYTNATTPTSQFDLIGVNPTAETFANFQTGGIVRVNNLADTLSTKAYARSVGGSGSSSLLPTTGTGTATGNVIGALGSNSLLIKHGANNLLNFNSAGDQITLNATGATTGASQMFLVGQDGEEGAGFVVNSSEAGGAQSVVSVYADADNGYNFYLTSNKGTSEAEIYGSPDSGYVRLTADTFRIVSTLAAKTSGMVWTLQNQLTGSGYWGVASGLQYYGKIYNDSNWTAGKITSDFVSFGGGTYTDSAGLIVVSGGATNFTRSLNLNINQGSNIPAGFNTNAEDFIITVKFRIIQNGIFPVGIQSTVSSFPTGGLYGFLNTSTGVSTLVSNSASNLTTSIGDWVMMTVERHYDKTSISVRNITTNSATITTTSNYSLPTGNVPPTTGQFAIFAYSGKFYVDSLAITSAVNKNADVLVLGDSKTQGYDGTFITRWATQLGNNHAVVVSAGGFTTTAHWLTVVDEINALRPRQIIMQDPSNDLRTGVNTDSTKARYYRIERAFRALNIPVYHINSFYETSTTVYTWAKYINSTRSADSVINMYDATNMNGFVDADNIHPTSPFGESVIYNTIINSNKLQYAINKLQAPNSFIANNPTTSPQTAAINITGASTIANNLVVGSAVSSQLALRIETESNNDIWQFGSGSINYIESSNDARGAGTALRIRGLTLDGYVGTALSTALWTSTSGGNMTIPGNTTVGSTTLAGTVALKVITTTNNELNIYDAGDNVQYVRSTTSSNGAGRDMNITALNILFTDFTAGGVVKEDMRITNTEMVVNENSNAYNLRVESDGNANMFFVDGTNNRIGIGVAAPTAVLHIAAGTATASTAPLKFSSGTNLTTAEAGAAEYDGKDLFFTPAGTIRKVIPTIISSRSTAQTAAVASVATQTVGASDASYKVSANILVTTSSAEAFTVTVAYTDESNTARTLTLPFILLAGTTVAAINFSNGAVPYEGVAAQIRCKASTTITVATTGTFTGATYNVEGTITKIQ